MTIDFTVTHNAYIGLVIGDILSLWGLGHHILLTRLALHGIIVFNLSHCGCVTLGIHNYIRARQIARIVSIKDCEIGSIVTIHIYTYNEVSTIFAITSDTHIGLISSSVLGNEDIGIHLTGCIVRMGLSYMLLVLSLVHRCPLVSSISTERCTMPCEGVARAKLGTGSSKCVSKCHIIGADRSRSFRRGIIHDFIHLLFDVLGVVVLDCLLRCSKQNATYTTDSKSLPQTIF